MEETTTFNGPDDANDLEDTRPIPRLGDTVLEPPHQLLPTLRIAKRCELGAVRERNEDSCLAFTAESGGHVPLKPFGLYIVADGMGGHENGHLASRTASRTAAYTILDALYLPLLHGQESPDQETILEALQTAVQAAHAAVYDPDPLHDAGTTLTIALVFGQKLYLAHVGDSRAYWFVEGKLHVLTNDHSLVQRLQDEGQLTAEEAQHYQYRNILLRALGQEDDLEVDTAVHDLPAQGKLLLCSDGLCGLVDDAQIGQIMAQPTSPAKVADQLYEAAMAAGGYDNITAVVVEFHF